MRQRPDQHHYAVTRPGDPLPSVLIVKDGADARAVAQAGGPIIEVRRVSPAEAAEIKAQRERIEGRPAAAGTVVYEVEGNDPRVLDLMRQIQILAQALDDLRADVDRRFKAQADHMNLIASEAIITPELRQGAA